MFSILMEESGEEEENETKYPICHKGQNYGNQNHVGETNYNLESKKQILSELL